MTSLKWWCLGMVTLLAGASAPWIMSPSASNPSRTRALHPDRLPHEQPQDVGWVFGRLVGVPGADKPLMSGSGIANRPLPILPTSNVSP